MSLLGRNRHIDLRSSQREDAAVEFQSEPIRFLQNVNGITADFAVEKFVVGSKSAESPHLE